MAAIAWAAVGLAAGGAGAEVRDATFELFVTDAPESIRCYEALGFSLAQQKPDGNSTMRGADTIIALSPVPWWLPLRVVGLLRRPPIGTELVFYTDELEALRAQLVAAGYDPGPVALQPWGDRDFRLTDPDGYDIRISEGRPLP
jgi:catechol 2,3-dioxygenase-like lactoylglutathione lyase family enzyme